MIGGLDERARLIHQERLRITKSFQGITRRTEAAKDWLQGAAKKVGEEREKLENGKINQYHLMALLRESCEEASKKLTRLRMDNQLFDFEIDKLRKIIQNTTQMFEHVPNQNIRFIEEYLSEIQRGLAESEKSTITRLNMLEEMSKRFLETDRTCSNIEFARNVQNIRNAAVGFIGMLEMANETVSELERLDRATMASVLNYYKHMFDITSGKIKP